MRKRFVIVYTGFIIFILITLILNLVSGTASLTLDEFFNGLKGMDGTASAVLWQIRIPRLLMAMLLGGALALSGFLLQSFFRNPIAGPNILGISSGAKLFAAICLVLLSGQNKSYNSFLQIVISFTGALAVTVFIIFMSLKLPDITTLLIGGIMVNYICSALTDLVIAFADDSEIVNLHNWSKGSFSGMNMQQCEIAFIVIMAALICVFMLSKPIEALLLGENYARSMGVRVKQIRVLIILFSCLLSAVATAYAGPVAFVGIAVPQMVRVLLKSSSPRVVIPACFLGGALMCLICDLIARCAFAPMELNISTVTSVFGAPVVILMLLFRRRR